jgi:hypothetical protein
VRFSTVAGERGSADTARDARGFAVKFYTDAGNWDLVGNNMPVFFIQDAMKFPDLIHAAKPEPNNAIPQAANAHGTFWDFVSLMPESTHMLMWIMSDRAIPRSSSRELQLRCARRDKIDSRGNGSGKARRAHGVKPQSGQLLCRNGAGRGLHGTRQGIRPRPIPVNA